jgi:mono/diheme cytochrome c family protein
MSGSSRPEAKTLDGAKASDVVEMMQANSKLRAALVVAIPAVLSLQSFAEIALGAGPPAFSAGYRFSEMSGESLFVNICRGCHMSDGKGAAGAGIYPSLAGDSHLEAAGYPVAIVVNGQRAMPAFGAMMGDDQVAAVVNYLRTHFGNSYQDAVTAEDVKSARR